MKKNNHRRKYLLKVISIRTFVRVIKLLFNDIISLLVYRKIKNEIDNPSVGWLYFDQVGKDNKKFSSKEL